LGAGGRGFESRHPDQVRALLILGGLSVGRGGGQQGRLPGHRRGHRRVQALLGIWIAAAEGARFWGGVLTELRNRGVRDVLIVCCDGLTGLPEAVEAAWPKAIVQTGVIHLIRASMRFVSYEDRKKIAAALRPVYTAVTEAAARAALDQLRRDHGRRYPGLVATWERAWPQFIPFLEFDTAIRKVIYTTNAIESINFQLRKIMKNPGALPRRRRRDETALPRHPQHHRPPHRRHRPGPRTRRAGHRHLRLETRPQRPAVRFGDPMTTSASCPP
jgi:Transposase, Mutator family